MGWIAMGTVEIVGDGGLEVKPLKPTVDGARVRASTGRVAGYGGEEEGCEALEEVGDALNPLDLTTLETLAFTRATGIVEGPSGERWEGSGAEEVGWNEPLPLRGLSEDACAVEVKERCLDKPCSTTEAFGLEA
jgi:hypothetical protein